MQQSSTVSIRDRIIPIITIAIVAALLGLLAVSLFKQESSGSVQQGARINSAGSLIRFGNKQAPNFTVETFSGETVSLEQYRGKTVILNFWASWCPPCRDEAPTFRQLHNSLDPSQVVVLGIDVWDDQSDARAFLTQYDLTYPNGMDKAGSISIDYGVTGVPETFFIGPDGTLLGKYTGPIKSVEQVEGLLQEVHSAQ